MNRIGYGAMQLAGPGVWGHPDDPEAARRVLRLAVELGVTFFDTANAYGPRTVNQLIGQALHPFPEGVIVGNKVGAGRGDDRSWLITDHPDTVRQQVHEALEDLGTDVSELTYLRLAGDTPGTGGDVPMEDALGVLVELRDQGLIRRIGLSGASPEMLARAQKMTPIAAVQNRFNLLDRSGVQVLTDCETQGIMFVPYFPLASGRLTSLEALTAPAQRLEATPAQVALAWLLRRSPAMVVIPGTSNPDHLRANIAANEVAAQLTDAEVERLTALVDESTATLGQAHQTTVDAVAKASVDEKSTR
ncbi:aldo/keto reductase [Actinoplanes friuliensis]|uniref:Aldo/keto reductase n=1 Tax=Actinoplanes friuliensis DSM 7358 TaxID=1246995 RepID=U5VVA8_9ACTN|nr:aldo/keto reductase [Actinoplanes friuliensis]AGZ40943.1 aldo/keto reductase [Actinoplanes friuliensis DSM 7358]